MGTLMPGVHLLQGQGHKPQHGQAVRVPGGTLGRRTHSPHLHGHTQLSMVKTTSLYL